MIGGKTSFSVCLMEDNSAFMKQIAQDESKVDLQKATLYPPPSAQVMQSICYSLVLNRFVVMLANSTMCIYKQQKEIALLEYVLEPKEIMDSEGKKAIN